MRTILPILLFILLPTAPLQAATPELYVGEAAVSDQGQAERRKALPLALRHVLQKVTGLRTFDEYPEFDSAVSAAGSMVLSFHYRNQDVLLTDGSSFTETRLVARFAGNEVDNLARSLQLPLWRPERSPLEAWLVIDDGLDRRIFPLEFAYARDSIGNVAERRGLEVQWPEPDAEGQYAVDMQLLWGGYTEELAAREEQGVMILAARREGPTWSVRINLAYGGEDWAWRQQGIDLQAVLDESMEQAVDSIAAANTIAAEDLGSWTYELAVSGLVRPRDYEICLSYLQGLSTVRNVSVVSAGPADVIFRLQLTALPRYLEDALVNGAVLSPSETGGGFEFRRGDSGDL
jgi:hypothetical protein